MKNILYIFISLILFGCANERAIIHGEIQLIGDSEVTLYVRDSTIEKRIFTQTNASNNKFSFTLDNIKKPTYAYIATMGTVVRFVLEPGTITISAINNTSPLVSGTKYNDMLYGWRNSDEAKKIDTTKNELGKLIGTPNYKDNPESVKRDVISKFRKCYSAHSKLEKAALDSMFNNGDAYAKLFSIIHSNRMGDKEIIELAEIEKSIGPNMEINYIRRLYDEDRSDKIQVEKSAVGMKFIDIVGVKTDGVTNVKLSDVVSQNKVTLLEFWASWCAPCRAEIPNMKNTYAKFNKKGFEIFSFSIDSNRDAWLAAEETEKLRWISTYGDTKEVSKLYVIKSIPASYLINSDGEIIARNLRGDALDKFIEDYLK